MPGSLQILVTSFFRHFGCVIFITLNFRFACLALLSKKSEQTIAQYFGNFFAKNNQKQSYQNGMKRTYVIIALIFGQF